jgi:hypothetical protein
MTIPEPIGDTAALILVDDLPVTLVLVDEVGEYFGIGIDDDMVDGDPQNCVHCIAIGDLCDFHRGYMAGRSGLAGEIGTAAEARH